LGYVLLQAEIYRDTSKKVTKFSRLSYGCGICPKIEQFFQEHPGSRTQYALIGVMSYYVGTITTRHKRKRTFPPQSSCPLARRKNKPQKASHKSISIMGILRKLCDYQAQNLRKVWLLATFFVATYAPTLTN
jgi:hypothetical protein